MQRREARKSRPGGQSQAAQKFSTASRTSFSTLGPIAAQAEKDRRSRLRRDLHRIADKYLESDPGTSALARAWALEVAA